jgi:hypothetical protein
LGEVLSVAGNSGSTDGILLRRVTVEDDLLAERLERYRHEAFQACQEALRRRAVPALLVDVEQLFDGTAIFFYFLGDVTDQLADVTEELGKLYAARIEFARFHETLLNGCGPHCGTHEAPGCGAACASCSVMAACQKHRAT